MDNSCKIICSLAYVSSPIPASLPLASVPPVSPSHTSLLPASQPELVPDRRVEASLGAFFCTSSCLAEAGALAPPTLGQTVRHSFPIGDRMMGLSLI